MIKQFFTLIFYYVQKQNLTKQHSALIQTDTKIPL